MSRNYKKTFLISEQTIKERTVINENVDSHYIQSAIYESQVIDLQQLIGTRLLEKLCTLVKNDTIDDTENSDYKELLDEFIEDYLAFDVVKNVQLALFGKIRNAGITNYSDTTETSLSLKDVQYLIENAEEKANFFGNRITQYLMWNSSKYPEYIAYNKESDEMARNPYQNTKNGFYLG